MPTWHKQVGEIIVSWRKEHAGGQLVVLANLLEAIIYGKVEIVLVFLTDFSDKNYELSGNVLLT